MSHKRGVVIAPPFVLSANNEPQIIGIHRLQICASIYCIVLDEIDYPDNDCLRIETCPDLDISLM